MSFDPLAPYGPVIESTVRVVTWNVWGRFGADWEGRQAGVTQAGLVAGRLGLDHHCFAGDWEQDGWVSGIGLVADLRY